MRRQLLLLASVALGAGAGCGSRDCTAESLRVYWTPGNSGPVAGFAVPGLLAAGLPSTLDCAAAGLTAPGSRVEVRVNDVTVSCRAPDPCVGTDWACTTGGVDVVGYPLLGGGNKVEIFGYNDVPSQQSMTYYGRLDQPGGCNMVTVGVVSDGQPGPLELTYDFSDGRNLCAGPSYLWFQVVKGGASSTTVYDSVDETHTPTVAACTDTLVNRYIPLRDPVSLTGTIPPGVYTRTRMEEVVNPGPTQSVQRTNCALETIVHAGSQSWPVTLTAGNTLCP